MRRCLHPLFAVLLSLLLLSGQQAALAHMLGHAAGPSAVQLAAEDDAEHGATLALAHGCTTCIAFAGIDAGPPVSLPLLALAARSPAAPAVAVPPAPTLGFIAAFRSRAPPPL